MQSGLTLALPPSFGSRTVEVDANRFTVGRTPENDLVIEDSSLSRRHALIEKIDGSFTLTDCGSSNGSFVNGSPVVAPTQLADWDVLTFGGVGDILVRIKEDSAQLEQKQVDGPRSKSLPAQPLTARPNSSSSVRKSNNSLFTKPIVAAAAVVVILFIAGVALIISQRNARGPANGITKREQRTAVDSEESPGTPLNSDGSAKVEDSSQLEESSELSVVESYASKVLTGISRDTRPVLTEKPLEQINASVQRYKGSSSLQAQLQAIKRSLPQVSAIAKSNGVRTPLAVYATLARIERDGRGDPVQVATGLCPTLARMRVIFGDELAADSLLSIAALEEGPSLQWKINKLAGRVNDSPATIRSVWYLHDHQVISDKTFSFVLRFLAVGVIAQDPQKFGIPAEPLIFKADYDSLPGLDADNRAVQ
jgi:pSer/pThr/pTyr-binding forkhead associated (FHA) protein